jgi:8-oxo-dGTP diphosphatase
MIDVTTLVYLASPDKKSLLMLYHNVNQTSVSYGKFNGLSANLGPRESIAECARRAVQQEGGFTVKEMEFRGSVHWSRFAGGSLVGHVFLVTSVEEPLPIINAPGQDGIKRVPSGELRWVTVDELISGWVPTWEGDRQILPLVLDGNPKPFHGYMPYEKGLVQRGFFER